MAERRCVVIKGLRLYGSHICLFDSPPVRTSTPVYRRGVTDICHIMQFPKPAYCKLLPGGGEIIAEIPFFAIEGLKLYSWGGVPWEGYPTPMQSLWQMWQRGAVYKPNPADKQFILNFYFDVYQSGSNWFSWGNTNIQTMTIEQFLLHPDWLTDDEISFSIAWLPPVIPNAPIWAWLDCNGAHTPYNSGSKEIPTIKSLVYAADFKINLTCGPLNFDYEQFLSLPPIPGNSFKGWRYQNLSAMSLVLVVRRGVKDFKVCWPESVFKKPRYAMLVDGPTGLVIGPPLEIY